MTTVDTTVYAGQVNAQNPQASPRAGRVCHRCGSPADYGTVPDGAGCITRVDLLWCDACYLDAAELARAGADAFALAMGDPALVVKLRLT